MYFFEKSKKALQKIRKIIFSPKVLYKTNYRKWADAGKTWGANNPWRAKETASLIIDGSSVLDIGAGSLILKKYLPEKCKYIPCDIIDRGNDCIVCDLNKDSFPDIHCDYITFIGVLEYILDPFKAIKDAINNCEYLIFTYNFLEDKDKIFEREQLGWISHITMDETIKFLDNLNSITYNKLKINQGTEAWFMINAKKKK